MATLTKAEEKIMKILWKIEKGFINDILEQFPDPKPPYNSVSTIVRVLVKASAGDCISSLSQLSLFAQNISFS